VREKNLEHRHPMHLARAIPDPVAERQESEPMAALGPLWREALWVETARLLEHGRIAVKGVHVQAQGASSRKKQVPDLGVVVELPSDEGNRREQTKSFFNEHIQVGHLGQVVGAHRSGAFPQDRLHLVVEALLDILVQGQEQEGHVHREAGGLGSAGQQRDALVEEFLVAQVILSVTHGHGVQETRRPVRVALRPRSPRFPQSRFCCA